MTWLRVPLVGAVLALSACGGGGDDAATEGGLPEPAAGPVPELDVSAQSALASPLPDVAIRQLNGDGGWVQFKNELPSEQPLLIWFWAPF